MRIQRWAMYAAEGAAQLPLMLVLVQHARGLGACSWCHRQRGYMRDMQPGGGDGPLDVSRRAQAYAVTP